MGDFPAARSLFRRPDPWGTVRGNTILLWREDGCDPMNAQFSRSLSLLRQEKGISQRAAAKELGISQALLSHYENGIREPGLAFVAKACDFYNVSADFLLWRTLSRDGTTILDADTLYDASNDKDNILRGSVLATLSKKLLVNSIGLLFDLLGKTNNKRAIKAAADYLSTGIYTLFRHLFVANPANSQDFFSISPRQFRGGITRVDMIYSEVDYIDALETKEKGRALPEINNETLTTAYPSTYQSLFQIIHNTGARMNRQLEAHQEQLEKER